MSNTFKILEENAALRKANTNLQARNNELEKAILQYLGSEGCSCCEDTDAHDEALADIAKVFGWPLYDDGSGVDWYSRRDELLEVTG